MFGIVKALLYAKFQSKMVLFFAVSCNTDEHVKDDALRLFVINHKDG